MLTTSADSEPEGNSPETWQLNYMKGTFAEPEQMEDIIRDYATAEDPNTLEKPHLVLPTGKSHLQLPLNRSLRSERDSETYLELSDCTFVVKSVLEARHHHEETAGFRIFHTTDYRKARLEREISIRSDEIQIDHTNSSDSFTFSALGSLCLPEALQGQVIANATIPEEFDDTLFVYARSLPHEYTVYGGFHKPIYE